MKLPHGWNTGCWGVHHCLYFEASLEGQIRALWRTTYRHWTLKRVRAHEWAREQAQKALDYFNATPLERLDLDIQRQQQALVMIRSCGGGIPKGLAESIWRLQEKRNALAEGDAK